MQGDKTSAYFSSNSTETKLTGDLNKCINKQIDGWMDRFHLF